MKKALALALGLGVLVSCGGGGGGSDSSVGSGSGGSGGLGGSKGLFNCSSFPALYSGDNQLEVQLCVFNPDTFFEKCETKSAVLNLSQ